MGGVIGFASKQDCVMDLFFGTDYHSHLGTKRGGMCILQEDGFNRSIHNIENSPFRSKFEQDIEEMKGNMGIGAISDGDLKVQFLFQYNYIQNIFYLFQILFFVLLLLCTHSLHFLLLHHCPKLNPYLPLILKNLHLY